VADTPPCEPGQAIRRRLRSPRSRVRRASIGSVAAQWCRVGWDAIQAVARDTPYTPPALSGACHADDGQDPPSLSAGEREALRAWSESDAKRLVDKLPQGGLIDRQGLT
jgi:hypothetical protein